MSFAATPNNASLQTERCAISLTHSNLPDQESSLHAWCRTPHGTLGVSIPTTASLRSTPFSRMLLQLAVSVAVAMQSGPMKGIRLQAHTSSIRGGLCSHGEVQSGVSYGGDNEMHINVSTSSECADACCMATTCAVYTHTTHYPWPVGAGFHNCTTGGPCCFLKSAVGSIQPLANCTSGTVVRGPTPSPPPAPPGNGSCSLARDCHYGGECVSGRCACDPTWTGPACERLNLLPARKGSGYPTSPATDTLPSNSTFTWGGAVVLDPEATQDR